MMSREFKQQSTTVNEHIMGQQRNFNVAHKQSVFARTDLLDIFLFLSFVLMDPEV